MPPAPASRGQLCYCGGLTAPILVPPLARPSLHSPAPPVILRPWQPHTAAEPVNTRTPLHVGITAVSCPAPRRPLPRPRRCPDHRPGALGAAWSTWSTTDFHQKSIVRGEADNWVQAAARKCLLITRKIIIPPPDSRDPPDGPPYFVKKRFPPDCWDPPDGPPYFAKKTFAPDCWDPPDGPPYFAKKTFPPLSARTHRKCLLITHKK